MYLLDTNCLIAIMAGQSNVLTRLQQHRKSECWVSSIVVHELYYGVYASARMNENLARLEAMQFGTLAFDDEDARRAGEARAWLKSQGTPIGVYDILIAGQALAKDKILVTRNVREFARVPNLRVENWQD